jgi:hypothetical protein
MRVATIADFVEFAQARRYAKDFCRELSRKIKAAAPLDRQKRPRRPLPAMMTLPGYPKAP